MKQKKIKYSVLICCGTILISCGCYVFLPKHTSSNEVTNFASLQYEFEETQFKETSKPHIQKGIQIPGYSAIPINSDSKEVAVDLFNPPENEVYFQISFYLTSTGEQIYQSKLIEPGQHLYQISLNREFAAGNYDLTIQYDTFTMDGNFTPKNGASVNCNLQVCQK